MINETFIADTPKEAYACAVEKHGTSLTLVSAKQIKHEGKLRSEIIVAIDELIVENISVDTGSKDIENNEKSLLDEVSVLKNEIKDTKAKLEHSIAQDTDSIKDVKSLFLKKGISSEWLDKMLNNIPEPEIMNDSSLLVSYLLEEIDVALKVKKENFKNPKVMMLVGSTGTGKTTTIAKLAARYSYLLDKPYKVALINLDSFKVGAFEQLNHYADIMQIQHIIVNNTEVFKETIEDLDGFDIILVDTAGMSPYDTDKFIETVKFVKTDTPIDIEVTLILPATVKYEDMEDIYQNFSFLNLDSIIISKFDETKHFGALINFMLRYSLPMSYFTMGQDVPDDLLLANKEYFLEQFIGNISKG